MVGDGILRRRRCKLSPRGVSCCSTDSRIDGEAQEANGEVVVNCLLLSGQRLGSPGFVTGVKTNIDVEGETDEGIWIMIQF